MRATSEIVENNRVKLTVEVEESEIDVALARRPYEGGWLAIRASILYSMGRFNDAIATSEAVLQHNDRDRAAL